MGKCSTPDYSSGNKLEARFETIIKTYKHLFGKDSLCPTRQYYTMCAEHIGPDGIIKGSELEHLTRLNFLKPEQFYGIDLKEDVIQKAQSYIPEANWIHGEFTNVLADKRALGDFNPAIINCDTIYMAKRAGFLVGHTLRNVMLCSNVMVVANIIKNQRSKNQDKQEVMNDLCRDLTFLDMIHNEFQVLDECYIYGGSNSRAKTEMITLIFYKKD